MTEPTRAQRGYLLGRYRRLSEALTEPTTRVERTARLILSEIVPDPKTVSDARWVSDLIRALESPESLVVYASDDRRPKRRAAYLALLAEHYESLSTEP